MGKPAARVSDMHVCPMSDGPKPHVGGPVMPPGKPNVLIGGLPAATVGNMCTCVGPPDVIVMGSSGVLIGGMPSARMCDSTAGGMAAAQPGAAQAANNENSNALKEAAKNGEDSAEQTKKEDFSAQFTLLDDAGKGKKNMKYEIKTNDGKVHDGKTDSSGKTQNLSGYTTTDCNVTFLNN